MLFDIFCTSPVENILETQDLPWIQFHCIFLLTKNYCLCCFHFVRTNLKFIQLLNFWVILYLKSYFGVQLCQGDQILGKNKSPRMYLTNCSSKTFLEFTLQYLFSEYKKVLFAKIFSFFVMKLYKYRPDVFCSLEKYKERY